MVSLHFPLLVPHTGVPESGVGQPYVPEAGAAVFPLVKQDKIPYNQNI